MTQTKRKVKKKSWLDYTPPDWLAYTLVALPLLIVYLWINFEVAIIAALGVLIVRSFNK